MRERDEREPGHGVRALEDRCRFRVWAPKAREVELEIVGPEPRRVPMEAGEGGWFEAEVEGTGPGTRYFYRLDGGDARPDPASRFQPEGVHGPSEVVDPRFAWTDEGWTGPL